ncbi:50S ribosomal protein L44e [Candidatus Woesearchaeota archaeon]|nr:50S ribosomal protein L44e [Candidatus Woesearchaeota archaeon]
MKIPKLIKRYCPTCKKHTEQKVSQAKKRTPGSTHPLAQFAKKRTGFGKGKGNLGKYGSKPPVSKFKMTGKKTSKKTDLRYECKECKKQSVQRAGIRAKKVEMV